MRRNQKGQALVEYLLIITVISVVVVAVVKLLGGYFQDMMTKSSCNMMGYEYIPGAAPGQGTCDYDSGL